MTMPKFAKICTPVVSLLICISLLFLSLGQFARIPFEGWPVYIYLYEPVLALTTVILILYFGKKHFLVELPWAKWIGVFLLWLVISFVLSISRYSQEQNIVAFLYLVRLSMYLLFFVYLYRYTKMYPVMKKVMKYAIGIFGIITLGVSLIQYMWYQNLGNLAYLGWDPHLGRLVGVFFDPPLTISILVLLAFYFFFQLKTRALKWIMSILFLGVSLLTFSRGGYLALFTTITAFSLSKIKVRYVLIATAILILFAYFVPSNLNESLNLKRTTSIFTRINDYEKAMSIWKSRPVEGIGYNHIRYEKDKHSEELITEEYNPSHAAASFHSSFLMILVTTGAIGLILYLVMLVKVARIHTLALYTVMYLSFISLTDNVLLHPFILFLSAVLLSSTDD